jgi:hypothetical protein
MRGIEEGQFARSRRAAEDVCGAPKWLLHSTYDGAARSPDNVRGMPNGEPAGGE